MTSEQILTFKESFPEAQEGVLLKNQTSIKIGGPATLLIEVSKKDDLEKVLEYCLKNGLKYFILGWGRNVVFSDTGFDGVVIRPVFKSITLQEDNQLVAETGVTLSEIIAFAHRHKLTGMENLAGIPSSLGGAIFGNAGAFGSTMCDFVTEVEVLEVKDKSIQDQVLSNKDFCFGYRDSKAKTEAKQIILAATLKLKKGDLKEAKERMKEVLLHRKESHPLDLPNAGCVFKNPEGESAGKLIEEAGLKGTQIGGLQVSEKHGNFIVNTGAGSFDDYKKLTSRIKTKVQEIYGVELEEENIVVE
ncbi:UDP-N-acetylmuramate dehydrogenase [Patescibacteria group bacterium]|nr:UDP-N-acetylmuramate dehydrogenase [Patescibacteria group bacterium]